MDTAFHYFSCLVQERYWPLVTWWIFIQAPSFKRRGLIRSGPGALDTLRRRRTALTSWMEIARDSREYGAGSIYGMPLLVSSTMV